MHARVLGFYLVVAVVLCLFPCKGGDKCKCRLNYMYTSKVRVKPMSTASVLLGANAGESSLYLNCSN
ncbi:hypothetical protein A1F99_012840 [Pyrenophora tritici-repentis]|nr:hypothetical protein A1F99_012840 [Pyrenophora tritici-repentis]